MASSRFSSMIRSLIFNNSTSQWNIWRANNKLQLQSMVRRQGIIPRGARFSSSTNIIYIAGIMVSCIGYGSIMADNQQNPKLSPENTVSEIKNLINSEQFDEACTMIQIRNLTDRNIIDFGLAGLMSNCYLQRGDLSNAAKFGRMHYDKFGEEWTAEQRTQQQYGLIMMYWQTGQHDKVLAFVDKMTETEITDTNVEHIIADCYYHKDIYDKYVEYAEKCLTNPKSKDEIKQTIYRNMVVYSLKNKHYHKVIEYLGKLDENELKSEGWEFTVGLAYYHIGDLEKALKYYQDHIRTFNGDQSKIDVINAYQGLGAIYYTDKDDVKEAYKYWDHLDKRVLVERGLPLLKKTKSGDIIAIDY